jgi:DNA helicase II / ATP-dependent DNA helicase PcrA
VAGVVHATLRHLIVDEYQDVNPAQERLIRLLTGSEVELCVVGDDDQAIYQWRGSDVSNIVEFANRYPGVRTFTITENRRSRPRIVAAAAAFARSIPGRLDKEMRAIHDPAPVEIVTWAAETEAEECNRIAETIQRLHAAGLPFRDVAVLVRGRVAYRALLDAFDTHDIPVQPAGRTGLFARPEAQLFGKTYACTTVRVCDLVVQPHFELDGLRWIDPVPIWGAAGSVVPRRAGARRLAAKPMKARLSRGG